ncbi:hypothetical protein [Actinoplanes friuliensis]|uniref:Uncharacterized protein n=1 Tax=Actinoplanes friuliensis DSM 7358 TaxID=1246995 RepID=U5W1M4_9ACTN|nr:hypothetical protein [Actinoplanes friuliensis]AGZ42922.1 hypothetical protein AFR_23260 [Actinoplanes friuliensis DSM 7358]
MSTDIRFRTTRSLEDVAAALGAPVSLEDAEDHWEWVLADLDGVIIDITRTHTVPAGDTDTRIFRYDNQPFSAELRQHLVDRLTAAGLLTGR